MGFKCRHGLIVIQAVKGNLQGLEKRKLCNGLTILHGSMAKLDSSIELFVVTQEIIVNYAADYIVTSLLGAT